MATILSILMLIFITIGLAYKDNSKKLDLNKGVIFRHQGNFLMTANRWTLVVDVTMDSLDQQVNYLEQQLVYLKTLASYPNVYWTKDPIHSVWNITQREIYHLEETFAIYKQMLSDLKSQIVITRSKRALDFIGQGLKFLFGVSTTKDIELLNEKIATLNLRQNKIIHIIEAQATVMNQTITAVNTNAERIQALLATQENLKDKLEANLFAFYFTVYSGSVLRYMEATFAEFRSQLTDMREAIDILSQGRLNSYFVPRKILLSTLLNIEASLPTGISLIESPREDNLFKYYAWITVTSAALPNKLRIFAEIPLMTPDGFFDLYEIITFPAFIQNVNTFVFYQTEYPYIALSRNKQSYIMLGTNEVQKCKSESDHVSICSPEVPIFKPPYHTCEYALFLGLDNIITELCEKRVSFNHSPIFRRVNDQGTWIYSTPKTLSLAIDCPYDRNNPLSHSGIIKLNNTGLLVLPVMCTGHTSGIKLTPHFQFRSTFVATRKEHLISPPILDI